MQQLYASWDEVRDFCKICDLAFIPTGIVETKGYHQPMGTDAILAEEMAIRLSERIDALVIPTIAVGVSAAGAKSFFGTLQVSSDVYRDYLKEICECLVTWGLRRFMFFSGHGPNGGPIGEVALHLKRKRNARCGYVQFSPFIHSFADDVCDSEHPYLHAGEAEASVMLHWRPELVKLDKAYDVPPKPYKSMVGLEKFENGEFDFGILTETGHQGDPTMATAEKGEIIANRMLASLENYIREELS